MNQRRFPRPTFLVSILVSLVGFLGLCFCCVLALPSQNNPANESAVTATAPAVTVIASQLEPAHTLPPSPTPIPSIPTTELSDTATEIAAAFQPEGDEAQVVRVIDGDTIEVMISGQSYRVRYIGMDTPERGDPFFQEATDANARLVANQTVTLVKDVSETDRYGRLLRYVYLADGTFVNAELVRQGYALVATYPPDVAHQQLFVALQQEAREAEVGLWGDEVAAATEPEAIVVVTVEPAVSPTPVVTATPIPPSLTPSPVAIATAVPTAVPVATVTAVAAAPTPVPTDSPALTATVPPAPGAVVISYIYYDGQVARVESDEYAVITNQGGSPVNLGGWHLNAGDDGQDFWFPAFELAPGQSCRVYTNEVHPETCGFSFNYGRAIWNNDGECGVLYDQNNVEVSRYCY